MRIYNGPGGGCFTGGERLPDQGAGFERIRSSRSHFWGIPSTIARLEQLAAEAHAAGFGDLYMGDISMPRGGPITGGHVSHQTGTDADIYLDTSPKPALSLAQRDGLEPPSMVEPDGRRVDPARFGPQQIALLKMAAQLPGVERVLVNPAIKKALCEDVHGDRSWLRVIRPWWGHAAHMHIHFACPAGQPDCHDLPPPPPGDGCDATLDWWFAQLGKPPAPPAKPHAPPPPPPQCRAVMLAPPAG